MKSIIYIFLATLIVSILLSARPSYQTGKTTIILRASGTKVTEEVLEQSSSIIKARLAAYGIGNPVVRPTPGKSQISVSIPENYSFPEIEGLLTLRGEMAFSEVLNRKEVSELLNGDNQLFRLLNSDPGITPSETRIGCVKSESISQVNDYLRNIKNLDISRFAWSINGFSSDESLRCLYVLKTGTAGKPLLTRSDIEVINSEKNPGDQSYKISFAFKNSAVAVWTEATRKNLNRSIAITVDNRVFYTPVVKAVIEKGICEINGDMSLKEVNYFIALVNNPPLNTGFELVR